MAAVLAAGVAVVTVGSAPLVMRADSHDVHSDDVSLQERHLPEVVNAPGTWSTEEGVRGPVAALGLATRTRAEGVFDKQQSLALFAVCAVDGSASWIHLPGLSIEQWGFVGGFDVSPDGQWIGWVRPQRSARTGGAAGRVAGWAVMNTTTGEVRRLEDPGFPWVRGTMADLEFSGDSRYLLTSYETPDRPEVARSRGHQLVAWDVEDGSPTVIEQPGHYWLPNLGSAPTGVVWARGHGVFRVDPVTGERRAVTVPQNVVTASWGPDDTSFAYIGRPSIRSRAPWRLYVGRDVAEAPGHAVDLPSNVSPNQVLGWRDATHVVVGHHRSTVHVVDVTTGDVERVDMAGQGDQVNAPYLAGALWQQPLVTPVKPEGTTDPRRPWRWGAAGVVVAAVGALLVRRRHAQRRL